MLFNKGRFREFMEHEKVNSTIRKNSHTGFIRKSGIFILLTFMGNIFELGFNGITARLPEGGYGTFNALFNIFFIVIAPLSSIQLVVSKEVSSYNTLGEDGKLRTFVRLSFRYVVLFSSVLIIAGLVSSKLIAGFLRIDSILPVVLLMAVLGFYSPYPVFFGTIQGLKKFLLLGIAQCGWGFFRFSAAVITVLILSCNINGLMFGVVGAVIVLTTFAWIPIRSLLNEPGDSIDRDEIVKAYSLIPPIIIAILCVSVLKNADIVFARRFFDDVSANAYTCAARVGSGFFALTGIIMVMFPHVSEEITLSRNPIIFLLKSFAVTISLSFIGILVAWFAPGFVMKIITLGKYIPGSEPLIRVVGLAVLPVSLVYIMSNYLLAKHYPGFLPILIAGVSLQIIFIIIMHQTPLRMLTGIGIANTVTCILMIFYTLKEHLSYMKSTYSGQESS